MHVQEISTNTKSMVSWLYSMRKGIIETQAHILSLIDGASNQQCSDVILSLHTAKDCMENAIELLSRAAFTADDWIRSQVDRNASDYRSATNSYERSLQTQEQSNVFLRSLSDLPNNLIQLLPEKRREAVQSSYSKADPRIIAMIKLYSDQLTGIHNNTDGCNGSYYSRDHRCVVMDPSYNHAEYTDVLKHELGHFIDHMLGDPSLSATFEEAIRSVRSSFEMSSPDGRMMLSDMMDDLFSTGAGNDRNVTDIISALFNNNELIKDRFVKEAVIGYTAYYQHSTESYWSISPELAPKEIFANLFAVYTDGFRASVGFVERWLPALADSFNGFMSG